MQNKHLSILIIFIIVITVTSRGFCQFTASGSSNNSLKSFFATVDKDFSHVLSSPSRMSKNNALQLASITALNIALIYNIDAEADEEIALEEPHSFLIIADRLADFGDFYDKIGPGKITVGLSTAMLTGGLLFKDKKLLQTTRLLIESSILTGLITYVSKGFFSRSRPYVNEGPNTFKISKFSNNCKFRAFPSGHTSHIFAMMTVMAKQYDKKWVKIPAYTLAVSVALQRIDDRKHWTSDVFMGGLLGYWVSSTLVKQNNKKSQKISVAPYSSKNGLGMSIAF